MKFQHWTCVSIVVILLHTLQFQQIHLENLTLRRDVDHGRNVEKDWEVALKNHNDLLISEEVFWKQNSREKFVKEGDKNTNFSTIMLPSKGEKIILVGLK